MNRIIWTVALAMVAPIPSHTFAADKFDPSAEAQKHIATLRVGPKDWPSWGGTPYRNNTPAAENIPDSWDLDTGENVLWAAALGSQTYGNPVIANGKVYVGTNNGSGYIKRFPRNVDLGCLLCFDEKTGEFLWQASSTKLPTGRVHDWPQQGICSTVYCEDSRVWYVTSRGEVVCLDAEGFRDGKNNGPSPVKTSTKPTSSGGWT
jgi:outer membrane protein assembly factor BamB